MTRSAAARLNPGVPPQDQGSIVTVDNGKAKESSRQERLAKALRDNLRRRKEQERARQEGETQPADPPDASKA